LEIKVLCGNLPDEGIAAQEEAFVGFVSVWLYNGTRASLVDVKSAEPETKLTASKESLTVCITPMAKSTGSLYTY
jgi:hypothetical protein